MQEDSTHIVIVDDHPLMRLSLKRLLSDAGYIVVGEAVKITESLKVLHYTRPNILIVDISLANESGYDLMKEVRLCFPRIRIIVYTMHDNAMDIARALRLGAVGFVDKGEPVETLLDVISDVIKGNVSVKSQTYNIKGSFDDITAKIPQVAHIQKMSHREYEVYRLLGQGFSTREISNDLHISIKTVHTHVLRIKDKLGLLNTPDLVRTAIKDGL